MLNAFYALLTICLILAVLTEPKDDDDGPDKGMMQPVYQGTN